MVGHAVKIASFGTSLTVKRQRQPLWWRQTLTCSFQSLRIILLLSLPFCEFCSATSSSTNGVSSSRASSSSFTLSSQAHEQERPPFLKHVSSDQLERAIRIAQARHQAAVRQALSNYPLSQLSLGESTSSSIDDVGSTNQSPDNNNNLKAFPLQCQGSLPDFESVIPSTVYVTDPPILSSTECAQVIASAEAHFMRHNNGEWPRQQSGQYEICGFYIHQVPAVKEWFIQTVQRKLFPLLAQTFPDFLNNPLDLCVDNAYLFKYTTETGRRTDVHTDSGCLSFTIALNPSTDYDGGGTWFDGLVTDSTSDMSDDSTTAAGNRGSGGGGVVSMDVGQVTIRPGGVKHCGYAVTSGTRYIIGGFCMHQNKAEHVRMLLQSSSTSTSSTDTEDGMDAGALLEAAAVLNPRSDAAYNLLAHHYESIGDSTKARTVLEYCLEHVHGTSGEICYALGSIYLKEQRFDQALDCMKRCLQSDPYDVDAMMGLATASAAMGDAATEEKMYHDIVTTPGANPNVIASAYCNLGVLHEGQDVEVTYYKKCLELLPDNYAARYSLACAYASRREWQSAVEAFQQAITVLSLDSSSSDSDSSDDKLLTALQFLYTATAHLLQSQPAPASREEMLQRFQDTMGTNNYNRLVALKQSMASR